MKSFILLTCAILSAAAFGSSPSPLKTFGKTQIRLDPNLGFRESKYIKRTVELVESFKQEKLIGGLYQELFGYTLADGLGFVENRIDYIVSRRTNESKLIMVRENPSISQTIQSGSEELGSFPALNGLFGNQVYTMAVNPSVIYRYLAMANNISTDSKLYLDFGSRYETHVPESNNLQLMTLGKGFVKRKMPLLSKLATLVHEARHTDCEVAPTISDLDLMKQGKLPENRSCGYMHSICPEGHDYAGYAACDPVFDGTKAGAYFVEAVYAAGINQFCSNCDAETKSMAEVIALDALSRVQNLDDIVQSQKPIK